MNFVDFLLLMFGCAGITWTIVQSTIVDKIGIRQLWLKSKFLTELFNCAFCTGFHVGIYYGIFMFWLNSIHSNWFYYLTIPFASACCSFFFERLHVLLIEKIEQLENNKNEIIISK